MKRILLLVALLYGSQVFGQTGARYDGAVIDQSGKPVVGINVRVCSQPASGQPCTPTTTIYSDVNLTYPATNPIATDYVGNFYFYVPSGTYELEFSGNGLVTKQVPDVTITVPGGGGSSLTNSNNTWTGINNFQGNVTITNLTATNIIATNVAVSSLTPGGCVQAGTGGALTTPSAVSCGGGIFSGITITGPQFIVLNGDFESDAALPPDGWSPNPNATVTFETATPYEGLQSAKMVANSDPAGAGMFAVNSTPAPPGSLWYITGAAKSDGTVSANLCLSFLDLNGEQIGAASCATTNSVNYQVLSNLAQAPAGSVLISVSLQSSPIGTAGATWYDAIAVNRADQLSPAFRQQAPTNPLTLFENSTGAIEWNFAMDSSNNFQLKNASNSVYVTVSQSTGQVVIANTLSAASIIDNALGSGNCVAVASGSVLANAGFPCQNVLKAALVTTGGTSDAFAVTGLTTSSHCSLTATNAAAATNIATTYISGKISNLLTVTHTATANMNYDILCTPN